MSRLTKKPNRYTTSYYDGYDKKNNINTLKTAGNLQKI